MIALAGLLEHMELAERRDVVEPGIGAGVGDHHQAVADKNAAAIGHCQPSACCVRPIHGYAVDFIAPRSGSSVASNGTGYQKSAPTFRGSSTASRLALRPA